MEKAAILKEMGFSDAYIDALNEFETDTPTIQVTNYNSDEFNYYNLQDVNNFTIISNNDNYSKNLIVKM